MYGRRNDDADNDDGDLNKNIIHRNDMKLCWVIGRDADQMVNCMQN